MMGRWLLVAALAGLTSCAPLARAHDPHDQLTLNDGTVLDGHILGIEGGHYRVELHDGSSIVVPLDTVARVEVMPRAQVDPGIPPIPSDRDVTDADRIRGVRRGPHVGIDAYLVGGGLRFVWPLDGDSVVETAGVRLGANVGWIWESSTSASWGTNTHALFFVTLGPGPNRATLHVEASAGPALLIGSSGDPFPAFEAGAALLVGRVVRGAALRVGFTGGVALTEPSVFFSVPELGISGAF